MTGVKTMSKLDELIAELCPDGVEYLKFGNIANIVRGASPRPISKFITNDENGVNWIKIGDANPESKYITFTKEKITKEGAGKSRLVKPGDFVLSNSMSFGRPYIMKITGCIHDGWLSISDFKKTYTADFLYYLLSSNVVQKAMAQRASNGTVKNLNADIVKSLKLPSPPLPIQEEIVRILDNFTELTAKLTVELTVELTARKQQYDYYRNKLLTFDTDSIEKAKLGEIADFRNGKGHERAINVDGKYIVVNSKFISTKGEVRKYSETQICPLFVNDILIVMSDLPNGRALAKCYLVDEDDRYTLNQRIGALRVKDADVVDSKFLYYVLNRNRQLLKYDNGVDQTNLKKDEILNILIPIPSLEEQQRIVAILDRFDTLVNDITQGLPAEIGARQKQYEYYRDKLLTFKEIEK